MKKKARTLKRSYLNVDISKILKELDFLKEKFSLSAGEVIREAVKDVYAAEGGKS